MMVCGEEYYKKIGKIIEGHHTTKHVLKILKPDKENEKKLIEKNISKSNRLENIENYTKQSDKKSIHSTDLIETTKDLV